MPALKLEDLDRDELLFLIRHRMPFRVSDRDLWRARWEILTERATVAMKADHAAASAWSAAALACVAPGLTHGERKRRHAERDRLDSLMKAASRRAKKAEAVAEAAYAAFSTLD